MPPIVQLGIGLLIAAAIIVRKVLPRRVRQDAPVIANVILLGYGTFITVLGARGAGLSIATAGLLFAAFVLAVGVGVLLALTIRVSIKDGTAWRRGTALTVVVWILGLAAHVGLDVAIDATTRHGGLGLLTIYLYLCLALISQNLVLRARARRLGSRDSPADNAIRAA